MRHLCVLCSCLPSLNLPTALLKYNIKIKTSNWELYYNDNQIYCTVNYIGDKIVYIHWRMKLDTYVFYVVAFPPSAYPQPGPEIPWRMG